MNRPPLAAFLDDPGPEGEEGDGGVGATVASVVGVLSAIVDRQGVADVAAATSVPPATLETLRDGSDGHVTELATSLTLGTAAEILAVESGYCATELRGRLRDHLVVRMSRRSIDVETLATDYGFGDPVGLRERIEGERPFPLREYARVRVALE